MDEATRRELALPRRGCTVCEHVWHDERCGQYEGGGPLFSSYVCKCPAGVELDEVDTALYEIRQHIPLWDVHHLELLAERAGREIPNLPSRAEASVHGWRRHDG